MVNADYDILLQSLSETIADYRQNEIAPMTPSHVEKWLYQFDPADRFVILTEMDAIMKRFYFSRNMVKERIRNFLTNRLIDNKDPRDVLHHTGFLCVQKDGSSQRAMLDIIDEILQEEYKFPIALAGIKEIQKYVYIDDAVYTGNRLRYDLTDGASTVGWLSSGPAKCTLLVYTLAFHKEAWNYVGEKIQNAAIMRQISLKMFTTLWIENTHSPESDIEVLWPERIVGDPVIDPYVADLIATSGRSREMDTFFQNTINRGQEKLFSSPQARRVVERAFLTKGLQLVKASQNPAGLFNSLFPRAYGAHYQPFSARLRAISGRKERIK
ncbi:MAG: hypothetical protein H0V70_07415 [Ktedonobacteraceae bacterium]|nr:hypothetical protein [Ktedonobacteraceae bacterium]